MDNNNLNIKFVGYSDGGTLKQALKNRNYNMDLETFYNAVNQTTTCGCSCCKQDTVNLYCIQPISLPIKPTVLSLCVECLQSLPLILTVIGVDCGGSPPQLVDRKYVRWV